MEQEQEQLKACPFCGYWRIQVRQGVFGGSFILCTGCAATVFLNGTETDAELIEAWNTRKKARTAPKAQLENQFKMPPVYKPNLNMQAIKDVIADQEINSQPNTRPGEGTP